MARERRGGGAVLLVATGEALLVEPGAESVEAMKQFFSCAYADNATGDGWGRAAGSPPDLGRRTGGGEDADPSHRIKGDGGPFPERSRSHSR